MPGLLEHFFRGIDEVDLGIGVVCKHHACEKAGAGAKIEYTQFLGVRQSSIKTDRCAGARRARQLPNKVS
ncbi:hypothetical protein J2X72_004564 [Phyllobacterium sp. 1468]|nr:hypothetical protein [Phyllobacterium sp. 1468]